MADPSQPLARPTPLRRPGLRRLVCLPFFGALVVALALVRSADPEERAELKKTLVVQVAAAGILVVHIVLQIGVELVRWLYARTEEMGFAMEGSWVPVMLGAVTVLNWGAALIEWGVAVVLGLRPPAAGSISRDP